ncbi:MAG: HNH endonuclease [Chitinophagaceae bacterium]|nr:MAG: HNH endonuclease [Chitinophagaceae bacterium]
MIKDSEKDLTVEYLTSRLSYDPETGEFTWKVAKGGKRVGDKAGSINDQGYLLIRINRIIYRAHRLAWIMMTGSSPINELDHVDGNRSNNKWSNLRDVTRLENKRNLGRITTNNSGHTGVMWYKAGSKWHAQITVEGKAIHLGYFENLEDAVKVRKEAEEFYGFHEQHGEKDSWNRKQKA